jgi:uncharacterized membrane protein YccC
LPQVGAQRIPRRRLLLFIGNVSAGTAIGDVVREAVDPDQNQKSAMFFLYILIVFLVAIAIKIVMYAGYGFGGGSLAPPGRVDSVGIRPFFYGSDTTRSALII